MSINRPQPHTCGKIWIGGLAVITAAAAVSAIVSVVAAVIVHVR